MGSAGRLAVAFLALLLLVGVVLWVELQPPTPLHASSSDFSLRDVTSIIPGVARWEHSSIRVRSGEIERISLPPEPPEAGDSPYAGAYVLPGLIDLHSHLPSGNPLKLTPYFALLHLAFGVTTIRDPGDVDGTAVPAARDGIESGRFPGPRVFACGPFIGGDPPRWPNTVHFEGAEQAEAVVARLAEDGFDCVKVYEDLDAAEVRALVEAGRAHGLAVLGHVPATLSYEEAGVPDVHHFLGVPPLDSLTRDHILDRVTDWHAVDEARLREIVEATREQSIANTPTLAALDGLLRLEAYEEALEDPIAQLMPRMYRDVVWHPEHGLPFFRGLDAAFFERARDAKAKRERLVTLLHRAGAELRIGSDTPQPFVVPGASVHQEMRIFERVGMTPEQVWAIATWRAARALERPMLGTIQAGAPADLLVFREDPTRDLAALESLEAVVAGGRLYPKSAIDEKIEAYRRHFEKLVVDRLSVASARWLIPMLVKRDY